MFILDNATEVASPDIGFKVFKLDSSNIKDDRTEEDLLKYGLDLTLPQDDTLKLLLFHQNAKISIGNPRKLFFAKYSGGRERQAPATWVERSFVTFDKKGFGNSLYSE